MLGAPTIDAPRNQAPQRVALGRVVGAHALAGEPERALHLAEMALAAEPENTKAHAAQLGALEILLERPSRLSIGFLKLDPRWASLWDQPRFKALEKKYG